MVDPEDLRYTKLALNNGSGGMPALGFGTLIPDPVATRNATKAALEAGFRQLDTADAIEPKSKSAKPCRRCLRRERSSERTSSS